jgi:hypothetical protein
MLVDDGKPHVHALDGRRGKKNRRSRPGASRDRRLPYPPTRIRRRLLPDRQWCLGLAGRCDQYRSGCGTIRDIRVLPTALGNGQRSPRKLLRAVVARLLGGKRGASSIEDRDVNKRVAVVARLLPGSRERAAEILAKGAPLRARTRWLSATQCLSRVGDGSFCFRRPGHRRTCPRPRQRPDPLGRVQRLGIASRRDSRACAGGVLLGGGPARMTQNPA